MSIARIHLGNANPISIVGGAITPIPWDDNNYIDSADVPIPIDTRYFSLAGPLPQTDITVNIPSVLNIRAVCSIAGLPGTGLNQYAVALYRDVGAGFQLVRPLVPLEGIILGFGTGCVAYNYEIEADFRLGVDPPHVFRLTVNRNSGAGNAEIVSRGANFQIEIKNILNQRTP